MELLLVLASSWRCSPERRDVMLIMELLLVCSSMARRCVREFANLVLASSWRRSPARCAAKLVMELLLVRPSI